MKQTFSSTEYKCQCARGCRYSTFILHINGKGFIANDGVHTTNDVASAVIFDSYEDAARVKNMMLQIDADAVITILEW